MIQNFLVDYRAVITYSFEIFAAVSGSFYLKKVNDQRLRIFVYYLWLTVAVELMGSYSYLMIENFDHSWFIAVKNSVFCSNLWLYNIYAYLAIGFISVFYYNYMNTKKSRLIILTTLMVYSLFSITYYTLTDAFFLKSLPFHFILGALILCLYVGLYFLKLINSDRLLYFYILPSFYISVGLLFWYLCVVPLFIFDGYFRSINSGFGRFRIILLLIINICTYSCFAFGFLYTLSKKKL